jgi:hypothetical protein
MREITIGDKEIRVKATPLALFYYKKEFNADIIGDLTKYIEAAEDSSKMDSVALLQMAWAMQKCDEMRKNFPSFEKWLEDFDFVDYADEKWQELLVKEAEEGFFRSGGGGEEPK